MARISRERLLLLLKYHIEDDRLADKEGSDQFLLDAEELVLDALGFPEDNTIEVGCDSPNTFCRDWLDWEALELEESNPGCDPATLAEKILAMFEKELEKLLQLN